MLLFFSVFGYVLWIRMNFASRLLRSQLFDVSQTQGQVLTGSIRDNPTYHIWMISATYCNYGAFSSVQLTDKYSKAPMNYDRSVLPKYENRYSNCKVDVDRYEPGQNRPPITEQSHTVDTLR